jgi:hypothetical protein
MDATGLWFSRLERNFSADYGQFRWTEEQRTWDWDKLKTVDLVRTKDGTKRLVLRRQAAIHTRHGRPDLPKKDGSSDASLRYMLGIDINDEPKDIECDYYTARVYDHYKNVWNMKGPKKRSSFQISENAWLWQWAEKYESKGVSKEVDIKEIHKYIKEEFNKKIVYKNVFNLDVGPHDKFKPVIYQPAVDGMKNFIREIHCSTRPVANGKKEVEVTLVFNNEELRKHKILNWIYERVRLTKYGRLRDIESFVIIADNDDDKVNGLRFTGIYSGKNDLEEDTIHGDLKDDLPPHKVKFYANDYKHPIIFINTSNHAMAEHDTNPDLWKWEYVPWVENRPFISGEESRKVVDKDYKNLLETLTEKLLKLLQ